MAQGERLTSMQNVQKKGGKQTRKSKNYVKRQTYKN